MNTGELREGILGECFIREDTLFSSGVVANNKLDIEKLENNTEFADEVVSRIGSLVLEVAPDFVVGVPNGANWLAKRVADRTRLNLVVLQADPDKNLSYFDKHSEYIARHGFGGVLVEDVFNRFTNTRRVLDFEPLGAKIISAVSVWDRGSPDDRTQLEIPHLALISEYIPEQLDLGSDLWSYA